MNCPQCNAGDDEDYLHWIGDIGNVSYYRCRACGWGWGEWKTDAEGDRAEGRWLPTEGSSTPVNEKGDGHPASPTNPRGS